MKQQLFTLVFLFTLVIAGKAIGQQFIPFSDDQSEENTLPSLTLQDGGSEFFELLYRFPGATVTERQVDEQTYQFLQVKHFGKMSALGKPALPCYNDNIAIPAGAVPTIRILDYNVKEYSGFMIHPALEPASDTHGDPEPEFVIDRECYATNAFYPESPVDVINIHKLRANGIAAVQIRPVQFNPVTGTIRVYSHIRYRIEFSGSDAGFSSIAESNSRQFTNYFKNLVLNSKNIPDGIESSSDRGPEKDYIIITHAQFQEAADSLAKWKRQMGYSVEVVSSSSWNSSSVKTAIHDRYANWTPRPDYFVIIGDHTGTYPVPGEVISSSGATFATDLYYACMDGSGDYVPEMAHGRISVSTAAEAMLVVQKIINYERDPVTLSSYYTTGANCAQFQHASNGYAERRFAQTAEEVLDYMVNDQSYNVNRVYKTESSVSPTNWNNGYYSNGEPIPSYLLKPGFAWDGDKYDIRDEINAGRFYILHRDHGYTGGIGWATPEFVQSDITSLLSNGDLLPVVFSMNCHTGEYQIGECFAETFIRLSGGGAVGVIGAAEASISGYNDGLTLGMFDAIWPGLDANFTGSGHTGSPPYTPHSEMFTMGDVLNQGLFRMTESWGDPWGYEKYEYELFHYFGDPAMKIWTSNPNNTIITATHVSSLPNGATSLSVSNCNVGDAHATLVHDGELKGEVQLSGGSGTITFAGLSNSSVDAVLTISKHNCRPYYAYIDVLPATDPPVADFSADITSPFVNNTTVTFTDLSTNEPDTWQWTFNPSSVTYVNGTDANSQHPEVVFNALGFYDVTLFVSNSYGDDTEIKSSYIEVQEVPPFSLPWTEDFEDAGPTLEYTSNVNPINGLPEWEYQRTNNGRLRLAAGSGFYHGGSKAATIDANPSGTYSVNYLIATLDLAGYAFANDLYLSFYFMHHGEEDHSNDRVWIRGSNTDSWVEIYDLNANMGSSGNWNYAFNLDIDAALSGAGQSPSSTFQIRFGQEDNYPASSTTSSDGFTFDDIMVSQDFIVDYCSASGGCDEYISQVQVGSINNITGCSNYADYTAISTDMTIGTDYSITVTNGNPYTSDQCGIWIDWNQDGDFYDTGEDMSVTGTPGTGPYTATINPPTGAETGTTTMRIRITYTGSVDPCGTTTYGEVEDYSINVLDICTPGLWTGNTSINWNTGTNWDDGIVPDQSTNVSIPTSPAGGNYPVIDNNTNAQANDLVIESGATLTLQAENTLTVNGTLTNNAGENGLVITANSNGSGSLMHNNAGVQGKIQSSISTADWHLVSSPVSNAVSNVFLGIYLKYFTEATDAWTYIVSTTHDLNAGEGFASWSTSGSTVEYSGSFNSGDVTPPILTFTPSAASGWNLLGNPYPSALEWNTNWTTSNIDATIYVYDFNIGGNYLTWNHGDGGSPFGTKADGAIPVGQGFWVKANQANPSLVIPQSERIHSSQSFYKGLQASNLRLNLTVEGNGHYDKAIIMFKPDATFGFDGKYDAWKRAGIAEAPQLYSVMDDLDLTVNVLPKRVLNSIGTAQPVVPVSFIAGADGYYVMNLSGIESFENVDIYLLDKQAGVVKKIAYDQLYKFTSNTDDDPERFAIHFEFSKIEEDLKNDELQQANPVVFAYHKQVNILTHSTSYQCTILNIAGEEIFSENIAVADQRIVHIKTPGIYVVRLVNGDQIFTKKVIIE